MKRLFDQNLSYRPCAQLADLFPESAQVGLLGMERSDDRVIWLRCGNQPTQVIASKLRDHAAIIAAFGSGDHAACLEIF